MNYAGRLKTRLIMLLKNISETKGQAKNHLRDYKKLTILQMPFS